jgi:hypothetical protein
LENFTSEVIERIKLYDLRDKRCYLAYKVINLFRFFVAGSLIPAGASHGFNAGGCKRDMFPVVMNGTVP